LIIDTRKGDLLKTPYMYIAHGCNAQGRMGSGVAKAIRAKYPKAYDDYMESKMDGSMAMGIEIFSHQPDGKVVINMITQSDYGYDGGRYVSYDAIAEAFERVNRRIPGETVAIPQIGAGLGGGNWKAISAIIDSVTPDLKIVVYEL
jgi:O-acetyl-ADP-ribose deacetylase (regulator of RNase III)